MRIFVQPAEIGGSLNNVAQNAYEILHKRGIASARVGGFVNDQGVVLVEPTEVPQAIKALTRAGLRAIADPV